MKRAAKVPSQLSASLHKRLNAYTFAASAAGVGTLALALPAEAKIVYTPADRWLPLNRTFYLDLNHDGVNDFRFFLHSTAWSSSFSFVRSLVVEPRSENAVFGNLFGSYHVASALAKGRNVGPKSPFFQHTAVMFRSYNGDAGSGSFGYCGM